MTNSKFGNVYKDIFPLSCPYFVTASYCIVFKLKSNGIIEKMTKLTSVDMSYVLPHNLRV